MLNKGTLKTMLATVIDNSGFNDSNIKFDEINSALSDGIAEFQLEVEELKGIFSNEVGEKYKPAFEILLYESLNKCGIIHTLKNFKESKPWILESDEEYEFYLLNLARYLDNYSLGVISSLFNPEGNIYNEINNFIIRLKAPEPTIPKPVEKEADENPALIDPGAFAK